jgi:single-strand DNA-binding protein
MNKCIFLGRITKDIELKYAGENTAIANFTLAVNRKFKKDGQPDADFLPMVAIGKTAEVIEKYCGKGSQITVTSRVQTRNWDDKDGNKHYTTEFVVEEFDFAGGNKSNSSKETSSDDEEFVL